MLLAYCIIPQKQTFPHAKKGEVEPGIASEKVDHP